MKKLIKPFLVILSCIIIAFVFSLILSLVRPVREGTVLLDKDIFRFKMQSALILFCKLLFATLATGVATGFSWAFAKVSDSRKVHNSVSMLSQFKNVLIVVTACTLLFIVASDLLLPSAETRQNKMIQDAVDFEEYTTLAKEHVARGEYVSAQFYAAGAYALNPRDAGAKQLADEMDFLVVSADDYVEDVEEELEEALSYLQRAQQAWEKNDFWNAHYYAVLAEETSPRDDETLKVARELAASAWNKLGTYTEGVSQETEEAYLAKKNAYDYLEKGDTLQAYYAFRKLSEEYPSDLDIEKYYGAAKSRLEASYFYTDETADIRSLENFSNVRFELNCGDGCVELYEIRGITVVGKTGQLIQYLRDMRITKKDAAGKTVSVLSVPYAKMSAQSVTLGRKVSYQPFLLLESVNRDVDLEKFHITPSWEVSDGSPVPSYLLIDMPYDDFTLIRQASSGPELMPLISLFKFVSRADLYGFPAAAYRTTLILRLSLPLFVLAFLLIMAAIGWNFRLAANQPFKTIWLLMFPLFTFVAYIAKDVLLYILKLVVFVLCDSAPALSLMLVVIFALLCVLLTSIRFVSLRPE